MIIVLVVMMMMMVVLNCIGYDDDDGEGCYGYANCIGYNDIAAALPVL